MTHVPRTVAISLALLAGAVASTTLAATAPPLFTEGFENGAAGWTLTGLWHVEDCIKHSGAASLAYNDDCVNYDVGTTQGSATTPSIPLHGLATKLAWATWYETEGGTEFDQMYVYASYDEGATWSQIFNERGPNTLFEWKPREIVVGEPQGPTLRLRFHFDSVDAQFNHNMGWFIDDVVVSHVAVPPSPPRDLVAAPGAAIGEIALSWMAPETDGGAPLIAYDVYALDGNATTQLATLPASETSYSATSLAPLTTYRFHVVARNAVGPSDPSNEACAKPFPWVAVEGDCALPLPLDA